MSLKFLITGKAGLNDMAGPLGIIQFASFSLTRGITYFFEIIAMISISLGIINLFPFPVLDGGHIVYFTLRSFFSDYLPAFITKIYLIIGLTIISFLIIFVTFNDIFYK